MIGGSVLDVFVFSCCVLCRCVCGVGECVGGGGSCWLWLMLCR